MAPLIVVYAIGALITFVIGMVRISRLLEVSSEAI